jgi:hypothetical protein
VNQVALGRGFVATDTRARRRFRHGRRDNDGALDVRGVEGNLLRFR